MMHTRETAATPRHPEDGTLTLARGVVIRRRLAADPEQIYNVYVPKTGGEGAPVLVTVHGISRNAQAHIESFAPLADAFKVVLVAPVFDRVRHPDFQRLGRRGRGLRADQALAAIVEEVGRWSGCQCHRFHLFGFSGGAQFAHRYAFAHPDRVSAMILGAAGWYTFPDGRRRYPSGIKSSAELPDVVFDKSEFLKIPTLVLVGEKDTARDATLRTTDAIDRQQGRNRLERARRWVKAMNAAAAEEALATPIYLDILPRMRHSFKRGVVAGHIVQRVFFFLFGVSGLRPPHSPATSE